MHSRIITFSGEFVRRLKLRSMLNLENHSFLPLPEGSTKKFYWYYESQLLVLQNENEIVGVLGQSGNKTVAKESLSDETTPAVFYKGNSKQVNCILAIEKCDRLFTGNDEGVVLQFSLATGDLLSEFRELNLGFVFSGLVVQNLVFFGGVCSSVAVLRVGQEETALVGEMGQVSVKEVHSVQLHNCLNENDELISCLMISGKKNKFFLKQTQNAIDISELLRNHKVNLEKAYFLDQEKHFRRMLQLKDKKIEKLNKKIGNLRRLNRSIRHKKKEN